MTLTISVAITITNIIASFTFEKLGLLEGDRNTEVITVPRFVRQLNFLFIIIVVLPILVNYEVRSQDFNSNWFFDVGSTIGITLTLNMFVPQLTRIAWVLVYIFLRVRDRGW